MRTPGPWRVKGNDIRCNPQSDDRGTFIAIMDSSVSIETTKANARLIAAAPDLLETLKDVWTCGDSIRHDSVIWKDIERAIAKAEGREGR